MCLSVPFFICSCCRCAVTSWSVCVTWAGLERTVTPRLLSVILWWDRLPQSQVEMLTLSLPAAPDHTSIYVLFSVLFCFLSFIPLYTLPMPPSLSVFFIIPLLHQSTHVNMFDISSFLFVFLLIVSFLFVLASCWAHVCSLKPAAFVFTEPCMSFFLFVIIFTLILCRQADVFDGVTWGQIWVLFSLYLSCLWCHFLVLFLSHPHLGQLIPTITEFKKKKQKKLFLIVFPNGNLLLM